MLFQYLVFGLLLQLGLCTPAHDPQWPADKTYRRTVLKHHNVHRSNHSARDVAWNHELEKSAKILARSCVWGHNTSILGGGYGQNIAAGVSRPYISEVITDLFYNDEMQNFRGLYGKAHPNMHHFDSWGHFTQIVWKGTKKVACATAHCPKGMTDQSTGEPLAFYDFTVCNYSPPGNYLGEFNTNVGKPLGKPMINAQY